ncbi:MAG: host specificity factor TipJ family phage tail protein, partial [Candidatus Paceibacterota bacterium]
MERLISTYVHNPFDPIKSRETKELVGRYSVQQCINEFCSNTEAGYDYVVSINGEFLPEEQNLSEYYLEYGSIVICAVPQGGGGKNPLRIIAMIAVVVIAVAFVQPQLMTFLGGTVGLTGSTLTAAAYIGTTLFATAGNLLVNALLPLSVDNAGAPLGDFSNSSTYGWDVTSNETKEGSCWPVLYGRAKIAPPIIAKYVEVYNDKQYLNLLCGVADHSMGSLDSATMQLDGNSLSTGDDLIIETRLGEIDQPIIQAFGDTRSLKSVGSKLTTDWTTVTTDGDEVEGISVSVSLPKGLWYAADDGSLTQTMVDLNIEYAPTSATTGNWVSIQTKTVSSSLATVDHWSAGYWVGFENWVEVEQGSTSATQHEEGETYSYPALEWHLVNLSGSYNSSPGARVLLLWHWKLAGEALFVTSIATSADCITIAGSQSSPMHRVFFRDHVSAATSYDIRMRLNSAPPTTSRYGNDVYFEYIEEIMYDDFSYPGATLLAVRALATDKISGGIPLITILANRGSVPVWNSTLATWCDYCSDNPAWASWDMLYNKNYGGGIDKDRIDYTAFATWATFCSANSLKCNIYFDQIVNFRKALDTVGQLGRGRVVQLGSTFTCFVDKVESTPIQGFMFNVANMAKNSFTEEFLAMDDRANAIEVTYWDEDYDYDRKTVELYGSDFDTTTREIKTSQVNLIGCTNRVMAIKHGQYLLNCNRYQTITASWEADIDSLGCMPWDVVEVQHDIPQWGYGGRLIQTGTLSTVILDQQITMATTGTYVIRIKSSSDDSVQEKTIDAVAVSTTTCTISPIATFDSIAATYDMYTVYENTTSTKWFRILHLGRKDDLTRKVVAIEYNSNVYSDSYTCATPESSSELDMVKGLRAEEIWKGGAETRVQVVWTGFALAWHVWHRRTSGEMVWIDDGIVRNPYIEIKNLDYGIEHEICVSYTNDVKEGLTVTITPVGKTTAPGNVTGLAATSIEDGVSFSWTKVSDFDLVGYKVRTGIKWQAATTYVPTVNVIPTDGSAYRYICLTGGKTSATTEPSWPTA